MQKVLVLEVSNCCNKNKGWNFLSFPKKSWTQVCFLTAFSGLNDIKFVIVFTFSTSPLSSYCSLITFSSEFDRIPVSGSCRVGQDCLGQEALIIPYLDQTQTLIRVIIKPLSNYTTMCFILFLICDQRDVIDEQRGLRDEFKLQ